MVMVDAKHLIISLLFFWVFFSPSFSTNTEGNALLAFKEKLVDPENVLLSWDPFLVDPCTWFHVICDSHNHVIRVDLGHSNISGQLVPEIGQLQHLQFLALYRNNFGGELPEELGKLKNLVSLDLSDNKLEGTIPASLGQLKSLRFLRLYKNRLRGPIPRELTKLQNLKILDVSNNDLCGTIPTDGPFSLFPMESFSNNSRLNGPELKGLVSYDFGC